MRHANSNDRSEMIRDAIVPDASKNRAMENHSSFDEFDRETWQNLRDTEPCTIEPFAISHQPSAMTRNGFVRRS